MDCIIFNASSTVSVSSTNARYITQVNPSATALITIFQTTFNRGCHQTIGKANGPTLQKANTITDVRKYHGTFREGSRGGMEPSKNSPQYLHLMASSWISSAQ